MRLLNISFINLYFVIYIFQLFHNSNSVASQTKAIGIRACSIRLYKKPDYNGDYYTLFTKPKGDCIPVPKEFDNTAMSVDAFDLCVILWSSPNCKGKSLRLRRYSYGSHNLALVGFNKKISSVQTCAGVDIRDKDAIMPKEVAEDPDYNVPNHPEDLLAQVDLLRGNLTHSILVKS